MGKYLVEINTGAKVGEMSIVVFPEGKKDFPILEMVRVEGDEQGVLTANMVFDCSLEETTEMMERLWYNLLYHDTMVA